MYQDTDTMLKVSKILDTFLQYMVVGLYGVYESNVRFNSSVCSRRSKTVSDIHVMTSRVIINSQCQTSAQRRRRY